MRTMGRSVRFIFREFGIRLMASVCLVVTGRGGSQKFRYGAAAHAPRSQTDMSCPLKARKPLADLIHIWHVKKTELSANIYIS